MAKIWPTAVVTVLLIGKISATVESAKTNTTLNHEALASFNTTVTDDLPKEIEAGKKAAELANIYEAVCNKSGVNFDKYKMVSDNL